MTLFGIDSGGTTTRVVVRDDAGRPHVRTYPSLNPASVADPAANWDVALEAIAADGATLTGWIGSASATKESLDAEAVHFRAAAERLGARGAAVVSNDMVPLLMGPPLDGVGTAVTVGTGTSFLARSHDGRIAAASGYEYLVSDEGGAFDIGLHGLRAAGRGYDGRGLETALVGAAVELYGTDIPHLGQQLAGLARPKLEVSRFAPHVCACASAGDSAALAVVKRAVDAVVTGIAAVRWRVDATEDAILLAGGVIAGCDVIASGICRELGERWPSATVITASDGAEAALTLAERSTSLALGDVARLAGGLPCRVVTFGDGG